MSETFVKIVERMTDIRKQLRAEGKDPNECAEYLDLKKKFLELSTCYLLTELIHIECREKRLKDAGKNLKKCLALPSDEGILKKANRCLQVLKDLEKMPPEMQDDSLGIPTLNRVLSALAVELL